MNIYGQIPAAGVGFMNVLILLTHNLNFCTSLLIFHSLGLTDSKHQKVEDCIVFQVMSRSMKKIGKTHKLQKQINGAFDCMFKNNTAFAAIQNMMMLKQCYSKLYKM